MSGEDPGGPPVRLRRTTSAGGTIVPGLIDPHCHLALQPDLDAHASIAHAQETDEDAIVAAMVVNAQMALAGGVTTVRDCGSPGRTGVRFREIARAQPAALPRVLVSGRPITTAQGHCHWMGLVAESAGELRAAVATLAEEGVDFIKVMTTGGMMTPSSDPYLAQYSAGDLSELVDEAHSRSRRVAAHALSSHGVRAAVSANVDTIEHCTTTTAAHQDYDPTLNSEIAARGIIVGVTAHAPLRGLLRVRDFSAIRQRLAPHRELLEAGVRLTVHSDAGTPGTTFDQFAESIEILKIGLGLDSAGALQAATSTAAAVLGINSSTGLLAPGFAADFLVVDGDVDRDISALRRVAAVAREGVLMFSSPELALADSSRRES